MLDSSLVLFNGNVRAIARSGRSALAIPDRGRFGLSIGTRSGIVFEVR